MINLIENYKKHNTYIERNGKKHWDSGLSPIKPGEKEKIIPNYGNDININGLRHQKFCKIIDKSLDGIRSKKLTISKEDFNNNFYYDMMHKLSKHERFFRDVDSFIEFIRNSLTKGETYYDRHQTYPRFDSDSEAKDARSRRIGEMSDHLRCKYIKCARIGSEWKKSNPLPQKPNNPKIKTFKKDMQNYKKEMQRYESCKSKIANENKKFPRLDSRPEIPKFCNSREFK